MALQQSFLASQKVTVELVTLPVRAAADHRKRIARPVLRVSSWSRNDA